jgi:hypothetical protein
LSLFAVILVYITMEKKQATDIDRKLAIYYHPLFQEIIKNLLLLFRREEPF